MQARTYVMKHLFLPLLALLALAGSAGCRTAHHAPAIPPPDTLTAATPAAIPLPLPAVNRESALFVRGGAFACSLCAQSVLY